MLPRDLPEHTRPGLEALAAAADARRVELGARLADAPPQWAREALGPVPEDPAQREVWAQRAGWAASYRELAGHTDQTDPLGAAPPPGLAEKHALFRAAHTALDLSYAGAEEEDMTEGRLRVRVAAYTREEAWAPRYVADELEATHDALRRHQTDATMWAARAQTETDPAERDQLNTAAQTAREQAEQLARQIEQLEIADAARAAWWIETAITRDKAERARIALNMRGIDPDTPAERVTAREWLDAHQAEQTEADTHREIRDEHDLPDHDSTAEDSNQPAQTQDDASTDDDTATDNSADEATDATDATDEVMDETAGDRLEPEQRAVQVEPPVRDIREISTPDPGEHADPAQRRRVPLPDETAATVARAQLALTEIDARQQAEAAENARLAELTQWSHDAHTDDDSDQHTGRRGRDRDSDHDQDYLISLER